METDLDFGLDDLAPPPPLEELQKTTEVALEEEEEEIVEYWRVEKPPKTEERPASRCSPRSPAGRGSPGNITIQVLVDREGKVEKVGEIHGNEVFHEAARKAALATTFTPAIQNDKPVKVWVALTYKFQLQ